MDKSVTITKLDSAPPSKCSQSAGKKTLKGILKKTSKLSLKGVADPAKAPAFKKGMKKHTLRLLTEKGMRKQRKTMKRKLAKLSDSKVSDIVQKSGLVVNSKTPSDISRQILDNAVSAGFVSV